MMSHVELVEFFRPYVGGPFGRKTEAFQAARDVERTQGVTGGFLDRFQDAWFEADRLRDVAARMAGQEVAW